MDASIVLVEGFPGCGKSTTAQWLARQLNGRGHGAEWIYEQQRPHPLSRETPGAYSSWEEYCVERLRRWSKLADQATAPSGKVSILDSAWLQTPLFLMLRQDLDRRLIQVFIDKTAAVIQRARPALIYLSQPDPDGGMRSLFERRGMSWAFTQAARSDTSSFCRNRGASGIGGLLLYWHEHNAVSEEIVRHADMPALSLDPRDGDWPDRRTAILGFLGIEGAAPEPSLDPVDIPRLVGKYRNSRRTIVIRPFGDGLVLDGLLWPGNRLVPVTRTVFEAESWPLVLTFVEVDAAIRSVQIEGPLVAGMGFGATYEKVDGRDRTRDGRSADGGDPW